MAVNRGEIWWYEHPNRSPRPYLILARAQARPVLRQVLAVPATRTVREIPTEVFLDRTDGMPVSCVLSLDNTTLIRPEFCTRRIASLRPQRMHEVCEALRHAIDC